MVLLQASISSLQTSLNYLILRDVVHADPRHLPYLRTFPYPCPCPVHVHIRLAWACANQLQGEPAVHVDCDRSQRRNVLKLLRAAGSVS